MTVLCRLGFASIVASLLVGCGPYTLHGRVVRSSDPAIAVLSADDPQLESGSGIGGVLVTVIREPRTMYRTEVARATSAPDGSFALTIDAWGAGVTIEEWLISAGAVGLSRVEAPISLPGDPDSARLLVRMTPGPGGSTERPSAETSREGVAETMQRFMR